MKKPVLRHLDDLILAPAAGGTPRGNILVVAGPLVLQAVTVVVLVNVGTEIGCDRGKNTERRRVVIWSPGERVPRDERCSEVI